MMDAIHEREPLYIIWHLSSDGHPKIVAQVVEPRDAVRYADALRHVGCPAQVDLLAREEAIT